LEVRHEAFCGGGRDGRGVLVAGAAGTGEAGASVPQSPDGDKQSAYKARTVYDFEEDDERGDRQVAQNMRLDGDLMSPARRAPLGRKSKSDESWQDTSSTSRRASGGCSSCALGGDPGGPGGPLAALAFAALVIALRRRRRH
jgi:MYXO-CTERM domain-containing protein